MLAFCDFDDDGGDCVTNAGAVDLITKMEQQVVKEKERARASFFRIAWVSNPTQEKNILCNTVFHTCMKYGLYIILKNCFCLSEFFRAALMYEAGIDHSVCTLYIATLEIGNSAMFIN